MRKTIIQFAALLFAVSQGAFAQFRFSGTVYDKATNQPIPDVYVSFNGTTAYTITDNSGKFELTFAQRLNTQLVFSHIAYNIVINENPFDELPERIYMEQKLNILGEVTVQADRFSRRQKLQAFREQFLGMTQAGRSCKIVNEDDIQLSFNMATKTFFASSNKPIEVINEYLGYRVFVTLDDFWAEYSSVTLNSDRAMKTFCKMNTLFIDLRQGDTRIKKRRDDIYEESTRNFFKNLAYNPLFSSDTEVLLNRFGHFLAAGREVIIDGEKLEKAKEPPFFIIYKDRTPVVFRSYFTVKDTLSQKMICLSDTIIEKENPDNSILKISVLHREKANETYYQVNLSSNSPTNVLVVNEQPIYFSGIRFFTDTLLVDKYGNIYQFDKVFFSGLMGRMRMGDTLPLEYEP